MPETLEGLVWLEQELDYIDRHDVVTDDREPWYDETYPDYDPEPYSDGSSEGDGWI